jgi:hypothetical protein
MTWEEHEKVYGIVLSEIPENIRIYESSDGYSYANNLCDGLTYTYNDLLSFTPIRVGDTWHCICKDDLYDMSKDGYQYQEWVIERIIKTEIQSY